MLTFPNIDPVAVDLGFIQIRWYGISYIAGILGRLGVVALPGEVRALRLDNRTGCGPHILRHPGSHPGWPAGVGAVLQLALLPD